MAALDITFGVELEFVVLYNSQALGGGPGHEGGRWLIPYRMIHANLKAAGIPVVSDEIDDEEMSDWHAPTTPYSRWSITDEGVRLSPDEDRLCPREWSAEGIEMSSPIFRLADGTWKSHITQVLESLMQLEEKGCRILPVANAGFHVHVGNGSNKIPLRTAKNICQLMTALERAFDELHGVHRTKATDVYNQLTWHAPMAFFHRNNGHNYRMSSMYGWLCSIEHASSLEELGRLFYLDDDCEVAKWGVSGHNCSVNFDNTFADVDTDDRSSEQDLKNTIEFRQHASTVKGSEIFAWVTLICHVVQYCHSADPVDLMWLCVKAASSDFTLAEALTILGCPEDIREFYSQPAEMRGGVNETEPTTRGAGAVNTQHEYASARAELFALEQRIERNRAHRTNDNAVSDQIVDKFGSDDYGREPPNDVFDLDRTQVKKLLCQGFEVAIALLPDASRDELDSAARRSFWSRLDAAGRD